jgi:hypothetical protein
VLRKHPVTTRALGMQQEARHEPPRQHRSSSRQPPRYAFKPSCAARFCLVPGVGEYKDLQTSMGCSREVILDRSLWSKDGLAAMVVDGARPGRPAPP